MEAYIGKEWEQVLRLNKLDSFDSIWDLKADWFEEPNERRGGWSGVSRIKLKTDAGEEVGMFLKRQENHNTKTLFHPIKGEPTFYREFKNIFRFLDNGISTVEPVYFSYRYKGGQCQAILMTKELEGFQALDSEYFARDGINMKSRESRLQIMSLIAKELRKMHRLGFSHNSLYAKHVFVNTKGDWEVKLIDLEKSSRRLSKESAMMRDLYSLPRRAKGWRVSDRVEFLRIYRQEKKLSPGSKLIWRKIHNRMKLRNKL